MADASRKGYGPGQQDQAKGVGSGGMSPADLPSTPKTEILSNRDTQQHSDERGLDSRNVQNEQLQDHSGARDHDVDTPLADEPADRPAGQPKDE